MKKLELKKEVITTLNRTAMTQLWGGKGDEGDPGLPPSEENCLSIDFCDISSACVSILCGDTAICSSNTDCNPYSSECTDED